MRLNCEKECMEPTKKQNREELIDALKKDGWEIQLKRGAVQSYKNTNSNQIITIHYHPHKTYGAKLLKDQIEKTGWSEENLRGLKLVK